MAVFLRSAFKNKAMLLHNYQKFNKPCLHFRRNQAGLRTMCNRITEQFKKMPRVRVQDEIPPSYFVAFTNMS